MPQQPRKTVRRTRRLNATIPDWLKRDVDAVANSLASSRRGQGGQQKVAIAALMLFLQIDPEMRKEIADSLVPRGRRSLEADLSRSPLTRLIYAASRLSKDDAETVLAEAEKRLSSG